MAPNILPLLRLETFPGIFGLAFLTCAPSPQSKLQALTPIDYISQHFLNNHPFPPHPHCHCPEAIGPQAKDFICHCPDRAGF